MVKPWQYTPAPSQRRVAEPLQDENLNDEYLAGSSDLTETVGLHLYGDLLHSLMVWVALYYELRLEHPGGINLDAKPDHVNAALTRYPWGVVYTAECHVLLAWGDVPTSALLEKRDLLTDEPLVPETRAA